MTAAGRSALRWRGDSDDGGKKSVSPVCLLASSKITFTYGPNGSVVSK